MRQLAVVLCLMGCRPQLDGAHSHTHPMVDADIVVALDGDDDASGRPDDPVRTIERALQLVRPGETVRVSEGVYVLEKPIEVRVSGAEGNVITIEGQHGDTVLDARALEVGPPEGTPPFEQDQGALVLRSVKYVTVEGLRVVHSHNAGITVRDSSHVELRQNNTSHTFSSGIAVWDSKHVHVVANEVARASAPSVAPAWFDPKKMHAPHEALTLSGVEHFVVENNLVHHGFKEGIDIKGDSKHGIVRGNTVHDNEHQGIYVDAWEGALVDVLVEDNVVRHNRSSGVVISAEGEGARVENIRVIRNRIVENYGPGVFISRFGKDGPKQGIVIEDNDVVRNGWGPPHKDISPLHWITGGLYLFSLEVEGLRVVANRFVDNRAFAIGCSSEWMADGRFAANRIEIAGNKVWPVPPKGSVTTGWPVGDPDTIVPCLGESASFEEPKPW